MRVALAMQEYVIRCEEADWASKGDDLASVQTRLEYLSSMVGNKTTPRCMPESEIRYCSGPQ